MASAEAFCQEEDRYCRVRCGLALLNSHISDDLDLVPDALGEAVLYVYEAGSRLEYIATESMVTGLAIDPFGSNTLLAETLSVNFNSSSVVK